VDTAKSPVARVDSAVALIVAIVRYVDASVDAAEGNVALIDGASVVVVAVSGVTLPLAELSGGVADITSAFVAVVALSVAGALSDTRAELGGVADTSGGLARIGKARSVGLAGDGRLNASLLAIIALVSLALVVGVGTVLRSGLAADTANVVGAAERGLVASIRGSALTADAEAAATTAGVEVLLASTSDKVEGILSEAGEVGVTNDTLTHVVGNNQELIQGDITIGSNTNGIDLAVGELL